MIMADQGDPCTSVSDTIDDKLYATCAITDSGITNTAGVVIGGPPTTVVTRSGRTVKPTEKALENYVTVKHDQLQTACSSWKKQWFLVREILSHSADTVNVRYEKYKLQECMQEVLERYDDYKGVAQPSEQTEHGIQDIIQRTETLLDEIRKYFDKVKTPHSVVSGLSRLSKRTTSSKLAEKRREELARVQELEIKLQYMAKEDELQKQLEDISREKRKLDIERQRHEAIARAKSYVEEAEGSVASSDNRSDRVHDYVSKQDPSYGVELTQNCTIPVASTLLVSGPTIADPRMDAYTQAALQTVNPSSIDPPVQSSVTVPQQVTAPIVDIQTQNTQSTVLQSGIVPVRCKVPAADTVPVYSSLNPTAAEYTGRSVHLQPTSIQTQNHGILELAKVFQQQMHMSRLPPPEPGVFSGDPIQFPGWLTSFELLIESRQLTSAERLHYLKRYLGGPAKECIEGLALLSTDSAYDEAKKILKERFGDNFTVANAFRQKLRDWPKISGNDVAALTKLSDFLQQCQAAMKVNNYLWALNDCHENQNILKKLPDWMITRWSRAVSDWTDSCGFFPPFSEFCRFMSKEAKIASNPVAVQNVKSERKIDKRQDDVRIKRHVGATEANVQEYQQPAILSRNKDSRTFHVSQGGKRPCHLCRGNHHLDICPNFLKKKLIDRTKYVKESKLCFGCLKPHHLSKDCRYKMKCKTCLKNHPTSLHDDTWQPRKKEERSESTVSTEQVAVANVSTHGVKHYSSTSMIVPVYVSSLQEPQTEQLVYAMLDTQSDASFITEKTCNSLGLDGPSTDLIMSTMSGDEVVQARKISNVVVRGFNSDKKLELPTLYSTPDVPGNKSHVPTCDTAKQWSYLQPLAGDLPPLLDVEFGLLIGYNCPQALTPREVRASPTNPKEPYAQRTDLGWSVVGISSVENLNNDGVSCHIATTHSSGRATVVLRTNVKEVFKLADFAQMSKLSEFPEERKQSYDDFKFIRQLTDGVHEHDGHYEMPLPFKKTDTVLPDNTDMALKRLKQLKCRLENNSSYRQDYESFMQEIIDRGYCEKVTDGHQYRFGAKWFIPHHGVYHPKKPGKIRVVFDCSAKYRGISLNDTLLQGPDMTNDLLGVLCRFRKEPIAISCDIEKMFYQFYVNQEHRDYLSFFWWENGNYNGEPSVYRMTVHLFGAVSSPGCANFGMNLVADDGEEQFGKSAADFVRHDFYVDDGLTSVSTEAEGKKLVRDTVQLCESKGLHLHKFVSNSLEVLQSIPPEERSLDIKNLQFNHEPTVERTLGLEWCVQLDCFQFKIVLKDRPPTRRGMLSTVYSLYDPLGLLSPVVLVGRQILQDICKGQYDWDSALPENIVQRWEEWKASLCSLESLKIDRCYKPKDFKEVVSVELHHFSDASTQGYGQCSYLRLIDISGCVHCSLVMAKSRVAPLKQVTIPRLELVAAVLSVRVSELLRKQLKYDNVKEIFWCDSQVTLGYISNDAKKFHVFVANRIQQIRDCTEPRQWKYIRSQENPADYASRGLTVMNLLNSSFWFTGPEFLWKENITVDDTDQLIVTSADDPELRKRALTTDAQVKDDNFDLVRFDYFSDWSRLKKAVALCLRYKAILKSRIKAEPADYPKEIQVEDLCEAETEILRIVQRDAFKAELTIFPPSTKNKGVQRKLKRTHALYRLDPFMDEREILRIGGRIQAASLAFEVKHPVILPKCAHVSRLIVQHCHKAISHQGRGMTMNEIRTSGYWILGCRSLVSSIINKCVTCKRLRGTVLDQKMSDLPKDRLEPSPPFTYCAVDYFGPFYIKERRSVLKRYGVVFTCMASRAVHLETANSMDTDSFINALRRFIAVRGPIRQLRSDMGSNFVGAKRELDTVNHKHIKDYLLSNDCDYFNFKMNVPSASHMGGIWERQIRTVRSVLSGLLEQSGQQLDDESLRTLMCEAMAIVNSRPLTADTDAASVEPLTPNHLLHMKTRVVLPPPGEFQREDLYLHKRWRRVQHLLNEFWKRWQNEYLQTLQQRPKWNSEKADLRQGDIVIVKDENLPRNKWLLAVVEEVILSADSKVRKVLLRIATQRLDNSGVRTEDPSFIHRPIHKLVLLYRAES